jgi:hypothetical protein
MRLTYFIFILGILSLVIWIYQSIILPSIRQRLRFELFSLRDLTRGLVINGKVREDSEAFYHLHDSLNILIKALPGFDLALVSAIETTNPATRERAEKFQKLINNSIPEVQEIFEKTVKVMTLALVANSLFWFTSILIAVIPIAIEQGIWMLCAIAFRQIRVWVLPAFELREKDLEMIPVEVHSNKSLRLQI